MIFDITIDTWKYLFYFKLKLSQNIFVPWVYVKIKQCASAKLIASQICLGGP